MPDHDRRFENVPTRRRRRSWRLVGALTALLLAGFTQANGLIAQCGLAGDGSEANPYLIGSQAHLLEIGTCGLGASYLQTADVDLASIVSWTPIGTKLTPFTGHYDGDGFAIRNMTITNPGASNQGLFARIEDGSVIDLSLLDAAVDVASSSAGPYDDVGVLAGEIVRSSVQNVVVDGTLRSGATRTGGLVGRIESATLEAVLVTVDITIDYYQVGTLSRASNVGGVAADDWLTDPNAPSQLDDVTFNGTITGSAIYFGGIVGQFRGNMTGGVFIGEILADPRASSNRSEEIGALVGRLRNGASITNSMAFGRVQGRMRVGGLVGYFQDGELTSSYADVDVELDPLVSSGGEAFGGVIGEMGDGATVEEAFAGGPVKATNASHRAARVGGAVGTSRGTLNRVFALGDVEGGANVGGLIGYAMASTQLADAFASGSVAAGAGAAGGLIGATTENPTITRTLALGAVSNQSGSIGGHLGDALDSATNPPDIDGLWDTTTTQQATSAGDAEGFPTATLQSRSTYVQREWAIADGFTPSDPPAAVWGICAEGNGGYPYLLFPYEDAASSPCPCALTGEGTAAAPYQVGSAADLAKVGIGSCGLESAYRQTANISLSGDWTPIGSANAPFTGHYDGAGFEIAGMSITRTGAGNQGLFGHTSGATLEGIRLTGASLVNIGPNQSVGQNRNQGLLVGHALGTDFVDVDVDGVLTVTDDNSGGVVGLMQGGTLTDVSADVDISAEALPSASCPECVYARIDRVGGVVGEVSSIVEDGVVTDRVRIENVHSSGTITGLAQRVGGIAGRAIRIDVENATSSLSILIDPVNTNGGEYVGGLIGDFLGGTIRDASASGSVTATSEVGGLVGLVQPNRTFISDPCCAWVLNESAIIEDVHATGRVEGRRFDVGNGNRDEYLGGLIGEIRADSTVRRAWASGDVIGSSTVGGLGATGVGGLIGYSKADVIEDVVATGRVEGDDRVGGLIGRQEVARGDAALTTRAAAFGDVVGRRAQDGTSTSVGGLIGHVVLEGESAVALTLALAVGDVVSNGTYVGGLIGDVQVPDDGFEADFTFDSVYARGAVTGASHVAGLIGALSTSEGTTTLTIRDAYAAGSLTASSGPVGGFVASVPAGREAALVVEEGFFDGAVAGTTASVVGVSRSTADLTNVATFEALGWGIVSPYAAFAPPTSVWGICTGFNGGYPYLLFAFEADPCVADDTPPALTGLSVARGSVPYTPGTLVPPFDASVFAYRSTVPFSFETIVLEVDIPAGAAMVVALDGAIVDRPDRPIPLAVGDNVVTITLSSGELSSTTTLTIHRLPDPSTLAALVVAPGALSPSFDPGATAYEVRVPHDTAEVSLTATLADAAAVLRIEDEVVASGAASVWPLTGEVTVLSIVVTPLAPDAPRLTTVTVVRDGPPDSTPSSALASLSLGGVALDPAFAPDVLEYTASVPYPVTAVTLTATAQATAATLELGGEPIASGVPTTVALLVGTNAFTLTVTAGDDVRTYEIVVTRAAADLPVPTSLVAFPADGVAYLTYALEASPGFPLVRLEASIDDGAFALVSVSDVQPVTISGLTNGVPASVRLRGVFTTLEGETAGGASAPVVVTANPPVAPDVDLVAEVDGDPPQAVVEGGELEFSFVFVLRNTGDAPLTNVWLDPRDVAPGERVVAMRPGAGASGRITQLPTSWYWEGIDLPVGGSANLVITLRTALVPEGNR